MIRVPSLREEIIELRETGVYFAKLEEHCLGWSRHPTRYALGNVVRAAAAGGYSDELYAVLVDERFRSLRQSGFGINELRNDLEVGRRYFSSNSPDLLRYMQIVFLEQGSGRSSGAARTHEAHCRRFGDFLQLDCLPEERRDEGLHRALRRFFPIQHKPQASHREVPATGRSVKVELVDYELGAWRCKCGRRSGFSERYRFSCACGAVHGTGRLADGAEACTRCRRRPAYSQCPECGTRVTLDIIWHMLRGGAHPSVYRVPLTLRMIIKQSGMDDSHVKLTLMHLPVPLGLQEQDESIIFTLPDVFWINEGRGPHDTGLFISLHDIPRYDRQSDICKIFEAVFRRTLFRDRGGYQTFGNELVKHLVPGGRYSGVPSHRFTRGFELRLRDSLGSPERRPGELFQFAEVTQLCAVASSPLLRDRMALVNRRLAAPAALSAPRLVTVKAVLGSDDALTPRPPNVAASRISSLDDSGIIRSGSIVMPGDVLVGVSSPVGPDELTPEERLLHAIFGELKTERRKSKSLAMKGEQSGRVLAQDISILAQWDCPEIPAAPGRSVRWHGGPGPGGAYITITLAMDQPLATGETLVGEDDSTVVVCGLLEGVSLMRAAGTQTDPDILVAADHPWAPGAGATHLMRIRLDKTTLTGSEAVSRAADLYATVSQQPWAGDETEGPSQMLAAADFRWLASCGAHRLALELYGPRGDCVDWRAHLRGSLLGGNPELAELQPAAAKDWSTLQDSPSEAVRLWDALLRSARIRPTVKRGQIILEAMTDEDVLASSCGEVTTWRADDSRTGLFSEQIFGPVKDWQCACGRYQGRSHEGTVCAECLVQVADHRVRRVRTGHIKLVVPVLHPWYVNGGNRYRLARYLGISPEDLGGIILNNTYVVTDGASTPLRSGQLLDRFTSSKTELSYLGSGARYLTGIEAIEFLLKREDQSLLDGSKADSIIIRKLPVLPPALRPVLPFGPGYPPTGDISRLYTNVISANDSLGRMIAENRGGSRWFRDNLQDAVDKLLDNTRPRGAALEREGGRRLLSTADAIRPVGCGTAGSLRDGFLRRPIDYSARTRLVSGDTPSLDTALLPAQLAWNLFLPLVARDLHEADDTKPLYWAVRQIEERTELALAALEAVCSRSLILLSLPCGPWPLIALRAQLARDLSLRVHPDLMDLIGWENLGERVSIFALLTREGTQDAANYMTVARLQNNDKLESCDFSSPESIFELGQNSLVEELSWAALTGKEFPIPRIDHLILCSKDWLGEEIKGYVPELQNNGQLARC